MAMIGGIFSALVSWFLNMIFPRAPGPTVEAQEAAKAATAETELKTVETSNAQVQAAGVARDAVTGRFLKSGGLRAIEQSDPNNRDDN
jgi:hypothetical protein